MKRKMGISEQRSVWRTKDKGLKMQDRVIYEIHLKCIIVRKEKEMSRNLSHCYSNELRRYQLSALCPNENDSVSTERCLRNS